MTRRAFTSDHLRARPATRLGLPALVGAALLVAGCGGSQPAARSGRAAAQAAKRGGVAHLNLQADTDYTDPALAYYQTSWQFEYATCVKLLNYPDAPAPRGSQLVPEAAAAMPVVSRDGRTYRFRVRRGFRFSPPSRQSVTAETFRFVIERDLNPRMHSPAAGFMSDIAGAQAYMAGKAKHISGIRVHGDQLSITLDQRAPDFLARIAMPFFCAVPTTTPIDKNGVRTVPAAGPYYVASWDPKHRLVLKRNPNYHGNRPARLDEIDYTIGVDPAQSVLQIEKGDADYAPDGLPPAQNAQLAARYGAGSSAARKGDQRYFVNPQLAFQYLALNTSRPLFRHVRLRKAVNYAIDRATILAQSGAFAGTATDQAIVPGVLGYRDAKIYPLGGPNVARARALAGRGPHGTAVLYTCNDGSCVTRSQVVQQNLKAIGIDVQIKQFDRPVQFELEGRRGEPFDIADEGWFADYADPYDFINVLLDGSHLAKTGNTDFAYFADPRYEAKMHQAARLAGPARFRRYAALDADIFRNAAPWASLFVSNQRDLFSARLGCAVYQPVYAMDLAALCLRSS